MGLVLESAWILESVDAQVTYIKYLSISMQPIFAYRLQQGMPVYDFICVDLV